MSRYPADTHMQRFLEESCNKERDSRLKWFRCRTQGAGNGSGSKQYDVFKRKLREGCPKPHEGLLQLRQETKPISYHKRTMRLNDLPPVDQQSSNARLDMKDMWPVIPPTRASLYDGFSKEGKGRYRYLKSRHEQIPETKYRFPLLSSWDYGWRLGDVIKKEDMHKPAAGRTRIVADTFYTRTGIPSLRCTTTY